MPRKSPNLGDAPSPRYASQAELIVLPTVNPGHVQPTDFDHAKELMAAAFKAARSALDLVPAPEPIAA